MTKKYDLNVLMSFYLFLNDFKITFIIVFILISFILIIP